MPKNTTTVKTKKKRRGARKAKGSASTGATGHAYVMEGERVAYVLVPIKEYERLAVSDMAGGAEAKLRDKTTRWVDADDFGLELAADRIAKARKAAGLTQKQLAEKIGVPQSQISRIERNPDRTTVRTLKRIAGALDVDVSALL